MRFLSPEVQLDIFKWLTFKQLIYIQQTNNFYKIFLNKYEDKLARKKFDKLEILYGNEGSSSYYEFFEPDPKLYDFQISEQLEKKWKCGIENSIPMFLSDFDTNMNIVVCELEQYSYHEESYYSQLPNLPKNIEDMKIARCILEQLFNCFFEFVQLDKVIFNPQMIKLLFDENKPNMPLQLHCQSAHLFILNKSDNFYWNLF
uniref:Uncharacterized protein n=1 Tax=Meloidogyne enterolobii TaxID=390850 RepID=A0A6V7Y5W5_MELEN|nr:unnamed protein product [Meloidogyne enterolobii]